MEILLILPGFILAIMVIYDIKLKKTQNKSQNEPQNKVHFYVARDKDESLWLYIGKPIRKDDGYFIANTYGRVLVSSHIFEDFRLNKGDYKDLKWEDEPIEVFLNLED